MAVVTSQSVMVTDYTGHHQTLLHFLLFLEHIIQGGWHLIPAHATNN